MNLFKRVNNRQATQLAYKIRCYPWTTLPPAAKDLTSWRRYRVFSKDYLTSLLNDEATKLVVEGREYTIVWAYGNTPTEQEWNKKTPATLLTVDLRFSPAIEEMAVAILDFNLQPDPSYAAIQLHKYTEKML